MADEVRTVLKDFNRDLLTEELAGSALPFESAFLAGFVRLGNYRGTPAPGPRTIFEDKVNNILDEAQPGELRFVFTTALTGPQGTALTALLATHDSLVHTAEQDRLSQDQSDLDTLEATFPSWDSFNAAQRNSFLKVLSRVVIREARKSAF
jgi:hypothetical protein